MTNQNYSAAFEAYWAENSRGSSQKESAWRAWSAAVAVTAKRCAVIAHEFETETYEDGWRDKESGAQMVAGVIRKEFNIVAITVG